MNAYRILVVDDEPGIREVLLFMLRGKGFECEEAENALIATDILSSRKFDLLITDFRMPRMNGSQLLEWCRKKEIHFPVIFMTADTELLPEEIDSLNDCCADVLAKPVSVEKLLTAIEDARKRNHLRNC